MPIHFTHLSPALVEAAATAQVLTPNERLAREFAAAYGQQQMDQGLRAWRRPKVASMARYLQAQFEAQCARGNGAARQPDLLSADAELLLWRELAGPQRAHLAELAADAWRLANAWRIGLDAVHEPATHGARFFGRLAQGMRTRLQQDNLITEAQLPDFATAQEGVDLHLFAFDQVTSQQADFLARAEADARTVQHHKAPGRQPRSERRTMLEERMEEVRAAIQWARRALFQDPRARIGIVFPYLAEDYHAIRHAFFVEFADTPDAYDISGGAPLADQPMWRSAALLLRHLLAPAQATADELSTAPFLDLHGAAGRRSLAALERQASRVAGHAFAYWAGVFAGWLRQAFWGAGAGSVQHQALRAITDALDQYAALPASYGYSGAQALQTLDDLLALKTFAPQRPPAPIQALGYLETPGLAFTHLWVAGLTDTGWPMRRAPNPLLSIAVQRTQGVPRIDHRAEAEFARRLTGQWRHAGEHLIFSWARKDDGEEHGCSALLHDLPEVPADAVATERRRCWHPWLAAPPGARLQSAAPDRGAALAEGALAGGASLLKNQALCPFRAWALHRLGLAEDRAAEGLPDAMTKGLLMHQALHNLYRDGEPPYSTEAVRQAVAAAIHSEIEDAPSIYKDNEQARMAHIMTQWLDLEARRPQFVLAGLEQEATLTLGGAEFKLRIDRVDKDIATGRHIVIDYKTGQVSIASLQDDRLTEPQLAMYALTDESIGAVSFAQVRDQNVTFEGLAQQELSFCATTKASLAAPTERSWTALRTRWLGQLEGLVREHRDGLATVRPYGRDTCRRCHLPAFCRVNAKTPEREAEDGMS